MFRNEGDVRKTLARATESAGGALFWFEAGVGGTTGFPDSLVALRGALGFLELKVGEERGGEVVVEARNAQRVVIRRLARAGARVGVLVGEKGGERLWLGEGDCLRPLPGRGSGERIRSSLPHSVENFQTMKSGGKLGSEFIRKFLEKENLSF